MSRFVHWVTLTFFKLCDLNCKSLCVSCLLFSSLFYARASCFGILIINNTMHILFELVLRASPDSLKGHVVVQIGRLVIGSYWFMAERRTPGSLVGQEHETNLDPAKTLRSTIPWGSSRVTIRG